jgi:hypothetical protein
MSTGRDASQPSQSSSLFNFIRWLVQPTEFTKFANMKSSRGTPSVVGSAASGRGRASSAAGSRGAASVRTASAPELQPKKKAKPATTRAASTRHKAKRGLQATKCAVCGAVPKSWVHPHGKLWHETTKQGDLDVPIGPLCLDCHAIMLDQVPEVEGDVDKFVKLFKADPDVEEGVNESIRINDGGGKTIEDETVYEVVERGITMDRPYVFFSASEYQHEMKKPAPVGKKWPTVSMPCEDTGEELKLWYFRDNGTIIKGPHRKGSMWVKKHCARQSRNCQRPSIDSASRLQD